MTTSDQPTPQTEEIMTPVIIDLKSESEDESPSRRASVPLRTMSSSTARVIARTTNSRQQEQNPLPIYTELDAAAPKTGGRKRKHAASIVGSETSGRPAKKHNCIAGADNSQVAETRRLDAQNTSNMDTLMRSTEPYSTPQASHRHGTRSSRGSDLRATIDSYDAHGFGNNDADDEIDEAEVSVLRSPSSQSESSDDTSSEGSQSEAGGPRQDISSQLRTRKDPNKFLLEKKLQEIKEQQKQIASLEGRFERQKIRIQKRNRKIEKKKEEIQKQQQTINGLMALIKHGAGCSEVEIHLALERCGPEMKQSPKMAWGTMTGQRAEAARNKRRAAAAVAAAAGH
jgi:hypothetical protein